MDWNENDLVLRAGIPRHLDPQDGYLRREAKQMKREGSPPPRGPGPLADPMKGREAIVPTVKEAGRSIHLIPREPGKDGIITQVPTHNQGFRSCLKIKVMDSKWPGSEL